MGAFWTTFYKSIENEPLNVPLNEPLNQRQIQIIKLINTNNSITIGELSNLCQVGRETIKRDIKKLKELEVIKRVGSDKSGYWKVIDNSKGNERDN